MSVRQLPAAARLVWGCTPSGVVGMAVLALLSAAAPVLLLHIGRRIIDAVVIAAATESHPLDEVSRLVGLEACLAVALMFLTRASALLRQRVGELLSIQVNTQVLEKATTLDLSQFEDAEFYDKLTRARREAGYRPLNVVVEGFGLVQSALSVMGYVGTLAVLGWWVPALLLVAGIPGFLSELKFSAEAFRVRNWQSADSRRMMYTEYVLGTDNYAKEVQLFGLGGHFLNGYRTLARKIFQENWTVALKRFIWGSLLGLVGIASFYGCYVYIGWQGARGEITLGQLTLYTLAFRQGLQSFQLVLAALGGMYEDGLYLSNLFVFLQTQPRRGARPEKPIIITAGERGIRFDEVTFSYPGANRPAVHGLSLFIPSGQAAALVGSNGAGKTTFIKLLTGLYVPTQGRITVDGVDVSSIPQEQLHHRFAVIFQDYNRYQLSLRDNVGLGSVVQLANEPQIQRAMAQGGATDLLPDLKEGLNTQLGRWFVRGTELSGGQWQKVALSRAFMREEADILVLDEPTSTLDPEAEYAVFQRFKELTKGRTSILISHRFSTVRLADQIFFLEDGALAEKGTHEELLHAQGRYARMFQLQAEGYR